MASYVYVNANSIGWENSETISKLRKQIEETVLKKQKEKPVKHRLLSTIREPRKSRLQERRWSEC